MQQRQLDLLCRMGEVLRLRKKTRRHLPEKRYREYLRLRGEYEGAKIAMRLLYEGIREDVSASELRQKIAKEFVPAIVEEFGSGFKRYLAERDVKTGPKAVLSQGLGSRLRNRAETTPQPMA
jgi:hypothetical protein